MHSSVMSSSTRRVAAAPAVCDSLSRPTPTPRAPLAARKSFATLRQSTRAAAARPVCAVAAEPEKISQDPWITTAMETLAQSENGAGKLASIKAAAKEALAGARMPTTRDEEFRYTDISSLVKSTLCAPTAGAVSKAEIEAFAFEEASNTRLAIVDGALDIAASELSGLPDGVYVGSVADAPEWAVTKLGRQTAVHGSVFAALNTALATDTAVIAVPAHTRVEVPIHIMFFSSSASGEAELSASAPRMLVCLGEGAMAEIVEEFQTTGDGKAFSTSVTEIELEQDAALKHSFMQLSKVEAGVYSKTTLVNQATNSAYTLVESRLGGRLTRHDVHIDQLGPDTNTTMRHFILCGQDQLHDLHTKLTLDHTGGVAKQLHKCIAAFPTSRGVFDGNVKVNRLAQQTDAGQLSRNLLLAPKATVNVKPNLQIIADDVACTHGCAVSDLSEDELFYFASRGISKEIARQSLVYSFGAEVLKDHGFKSLNERLQSRVKSILSLVY